jgi:NAD(P)-dependent dehydrogenase (short-subunit alcohol dehydrogenase family)
MKSTNQPQVILITGAARGLGRALAEEFARQHAKLALLDLPNSQLIDVAYELHKLGAPGVYIASVDVTSVERLSKALAESIETLGPIDVLVANAGIAIDTPMTPFALDAFKKQIDVNLVGVANSIAAVLPGMLQRQSGHIVAIASLSGYRGLPGLAGYCTSKAGVIALMDSVRVDLRKHGIRCTTVCPGWINTGVYHTLTSAKPGVTDLQTAARKIVRAVNHGKQFLAFPKWLWLLFVLNRNLPTRIGDWMLRGFWKMFGGN